jgi:hypothetical protein
LRLSSIAADGRTAAARDHEQSPRARKLKGWARAANGVLVSDEGDG